MALEGKVQPTGELTVRLIKYNSLGQKFKRFRERIRGATQVLKGEAGIIYAELSIRHHIHAEDKWVDYGVVSRKAVTTEWVNLIVDELNNNSQSHDRLRAFKFHDSGTSATAEAIGDTALGAKVETGRATGSQLEGAANIYRSVGTISYTATRLLREHGLFSAASGSDELMDRSVFPLITAEDLDSVEYTYNLTVAAGG